MSFVNQALAMSVEPTPNAKQPSTPAMQVLGVGADHDLAGQGEVFNYRVMTNRFRTAIRILAIELYALLLRETFLRGGETFRPFRAIPSRDASATSLCLRTSGDREKQRRIRAQ